MEPAADSASVQQVSPVTVHRLAVLDRYLVRPGDTLSSIAGRFCGDPGDYLSLAYNNEVRDPDLIYAGQVFRLACQAAAQAVADRYPTPAGQPAAPPAPVMRATAVPARPQAAQQPARPAPARLRPAAPRLAAAAVSGPPGSMQACIIARESGGNSQVVNPASGAGGLYQFLPSTWHALGHSGLPENASVAEQNQAFAQEVAQGGYSAWAPYDGCLRGFDAVVPYT
jgi:LysM repeat protein